MKYIPILFSTPMVQAILDNRKTQTRRTKGLELINDNPNEFIWLDEYHQDDIPRPAIKYDDRFYYAFTGKRSNMVTTVTYCPYGKVGDILWVRETFKEAPEQCTWKTFSYKADYNSHLAELGKWKPSLFMPKAACRIFLKITNVRVERLQDISEEDSKAEGAIRGIYRQGPNILKGEFQLEHNNHAHYKDGFRFIWQSINGEQSWNDNPFVWCIEFERIEKPENFI